MIYSTGCFVAIDFETADYWPDSACSVGLVRVVGNQIVDSAHFFIRPPRRTFVFTYLHGISWKHVANEPTPTFAIRTEKQSFSGINHLETLDITGVDFQNGL